MATNMKNDITIVERYCILYRKFKERAEIIKECFSIYQMFFKHYILERDNDQGLHNILVLFIMVNNTLYYEHEYLQKGAISLLNTT